VNDLLRNATERLRGAGIESPRSEARLFWEHANNNLELFELAVARRLAHEPLAYITGHKEFWSLAFEVGPGVLIPRPETETLVEATLRALPDRDGQYRVLDLGTGSGCLLVAILTEYPNATGIGVDRAGNALRWARRNVTRHRLEARAELVSGNWDAALGVFDLILSNPPYIPTGDLAGLPSDIRGYEPQAALDGGPDGLSAYRALAPVLAAKLDAGGLAVLEMGAGQSHLVQEIAEAAGFRVTEIAPDLAGISRTMVLRPVKQPQD
jgi:release factor glutamine methyltransferase